MNKSNTESERIYNIKHFPQRVELAWRKKGFKDRADFAENNGNGITQQDITNWKAGKVPSVKKLIAIANSCDCDLEYLLGRTNVLNYMNQPMQNETGFAEDIIEMLKAETQREQESGDAFTEIFDAPILPRSTRIRLVETVIRNWDSIADNIDFINAYRFHTIALDGFDIDMLVKACHGIHNAIPDEFERWQAFRDCFWNEYGRNKYTENSIYHIYMHICNSHAINAARFAISKEFDRIAEELLSPISGNSAEDK